VRVFRFDDFRGRGSELVHEKSIRRFRGVDIEVFVAEVSALGDGLYQVGLDNHTGFLLVQGADVTFIHSGMGFPPIVRAERALNASYLIESQYRVVGKLSADVALMEKWLRP
jgi:hypothetical protein